MAASWSTTCGSRIRDRNGGSSIADSVSCWLVMTKMADPLSCWHLMACGGGPQIEVAAHDGSLWRHWTVTVDYTGIRWWIMIVGAADHRLIAAGLPDI